MADASSHDPDGTAGSGGMPGGDMDPESPGGGMPDGRMNAAEPGVGDEPPGLSRFPGDGGAGPELQPGLVEVEFRESVQPEVLGASARGGDALRSPSAELDRLNSILREHAVVSVEPSFRQGPDEAAAASETARGGGLAVPGLSNFVTLRFPPDADTVRIASELGSLPEVERAVPVPTYLPPSATLALEQVAVPGMFAEPSAAPPAPLDEPLVGSSDQVATNPLGQEFQWYLFRCGANQAWSTASGSNVVVADIDWGYRVTHQDLASRIDPARAYNAYDGGSNVSFGDTSHGTAVMGIAGAADNDLGLAGIAFGASLWPVQANAGPGAALPGNPWANAIDWVRTAGSGGRRKVVILEVQTGSYGNIEMVPSVNAAIKNAIAAGVVVCVAAGNGNRDATRDDLGNPIPPTGSILVGATAYHPTSNPRASFSNYGPTVVVAAPGDPSHDVTCSSSADNAYRNGFGGTSGATPKVAAAAALMLQVNPALTHAQVRDILRATGTPVVTDAAKPVGTFLNVKAAVQAAMPPSWKPWASLGGSCRFGPAIARRSASTLDAFAIDNQGALVHNHFNGSGWTGFTSLGGVAIHAPAAVGRAGNLLDAFVIGTDGAAFHRAFDGAAWGPFATLGGVCTRGLAAASPASNRLDVFTVGTDNAVFHNTRTGTAAWSGWVSRGGAAYSAPAAVSRGPGRLDVFYVGANNAVYHLAFDGTAWAPPVSLGGNAQRGVAASWDGSTLSVFAVGMNNQVHRKTLAAGAWSGWSGLAGVCVSAPAAVSRAANRIDLLAIATNSQLYHRAFG